MLGPLCLRDFPLDVWSLQMGTVSMPLTSHEVPALETRE